MAEASKSKRVVSADEAREYVKDPKHAAVQGVRDLAHTVVVQSDQIAAAIALHKMWHHPKRGEVCARCFEAYPCPTARALGVTE